MHQARRFNNVAREIKEPVKALFTDENSQVKQCARVFGKAERCRKQVLDDEHARDARPGCECHSAKARAAFFVRLGQCS